jgi:hypothetical protein
MSNLLRSLSASAKALTTGNVSALTGYDEKKARQQYNREQSQRSAGRYHKKETPEEYNRRKAEEIVNGKQASKPKGKHGNSPELFKRMGVHYNANKIKERGYNRG